MLVTDTAASEQQRYIWTIGDYPAVARRLLPISLDLLDALAITSGTTVLDVGTGDGNTAIEAARRGAAVTGVDLTPAQLDKARERAAAAGVEVDFGEADAAALPHDDASYDAVVSVMGMIFAPDHQRATAELARVCRPGGHVAITSWLNSDESWFQGWRRHAAHLLPEPPPGSPEPDAWGAAAEMQLRLAAAGLDAKVEERPFTWDFPSSEAGIDFLTTNAGPFVAFLEGAAARGVKEEAKAALLAAIEETNRATDGTVSLNAPYLLAVARR